jgi:hypothetical protein
MKDELLYILHKQAQRYIARSNKASRDGNKVCAFVNYQLFNLCYNVRDILRK